MLNIFYGQNMKQMSRDARELLGGLTLEGCEMGMAFPLGQAADCCLRKPPAPRWAVHPAADCLPGKGLRRAREVT